MVVWDYFMRRKGLLLALMALFTLSGIISGYFLQHSTTYVSSPTESQYQIESENPDLAPTVEVGDSTTATGTVHVPILSEEEVATVDVPLTGGDSTVASAESTELLDKWQKLFSTWQKTSWAISGAVILAFVLILFARRFLSK